MSARNGMTPLTDAERERVRVCMADHRETWSVIHYHCNFSAFSGYHRTPSAYSLVKCGRCGRRWRTKAAYVEGLPR